MYFCFDSIFDSVVVNYVDLLFNCSFFDFVIKGIYFDELIVLLCEYDLLFKIEFGDC